MKITFDIEGLEDVDEILNKIAPKKAKNLMRTTVHGYVGQIVKLAKKNASSSRRTGNLIKAIKAKREKSHPLRPKSSVLITRGKNAKNDAFYWRFVEYGTGGGSGSHGGKKVNRKMKRSGASNAKPFIFPAVHAMNSKKVSVMREQFGLKLRGAIKRELKARR